MANRLKVWGGNTFPKGGAGQRRRIVAATTQKEAAGVVGCSIYEFRGYWVETANEAELSLAFSSPFRLIDVRAV